MTAERRATTLRLSLSTLEWLKVEALRARLSMTAFLETVIDMERDHLGRGGLCGTLPCPACGVAAFYTRTADRFMHADGSANAACWQAITTGGAAGDERTPTELERRMKRGS